MRSFMAGMIVGAAVFAAGMYWSATSARAQAPNSSDRLMSALETLAQGAVVNAQTLRQIDERLKFLVLATQGQACLTANNQMHSRGVGGAISAEGREVAERAWDAHNCDEFYAALLGEKGA